MTNERFLQSNDGDNGAIDEIANIVTLVGVVIIMVGIGASCKVELFGRLLKSPKALKAAVVGTGCQFVFMPVAAYLLTLIFGFEGYTALGLVLTGAMPGGNMSNIFAKWGRGVLELSVFMTLFSAVAAFGLTPLWVYAFSRIIDGVDEVGFSFGDMVRSMVVLIVPLGIGFGLNFVPCLKGVRFETPLNVSAAVVLLAILGLMLVQYPDIFQLYTTWDIAVSAGIFFPMAAGFSYAFASLMRFSPSVRRTVMLEVGFQNMALVVAIVKRSVDSKSELCRVLPFPVVYGFFQLLWGIVLVPLMRWQKRRNDERGIKDAEDDFLIEEEKAPEGTDVDSDEEAQSAGIGAAPEDCSGAREIQDPSDDAAHVAAS